MAIGTVQEIQFNVQKQSKAGKTYSVTMLKFVTEKGQLKTENCFSDCDYKDVLKGLAPGDKIDAKYVKNGEYFNLTDVQLVEKGSGVAPSPTRSGGGSGSKEDPEKQAAIIRQNALTNAVGFVLNERVFATLKGDKTKIDADFLSDLVVNYAKKFEKYTSGKDITEALSQAVASDTPSNIPE